jgi:protein-tyrosine phosphatase
MVCMGNICRSPTAEGVLRHKLREAGLDKVVDVDSAGTHAYHVGEAPDPRSTRHARQRGYDLSALRARQVREADFEQFEFVLAMDWDNLSDLEDRCPVPYRSKVRRLVEFSRRLKSDIVPDPYSGGAEGFEYVLDLVEDACDGLVEHLSAAASQQNSGTS